MELYVYTLCFFLGTVLFERFIHDVVCSNSLFLLLYGNSTQLHFTVYSSVDVYLGHFQFRVTVNNAAVIFFVCAFGNTRMNGFLFVAPLRLGSLGHIFKFVEGPTKRFSKWLYPVYASIISL